MPNTPLTNRQGGLLVKLFMAGLVAQLALLGYVFYQSYQGRENVVLASRRGCERSRLDREANALGWRAAEAARLHNVAQELHISFDQVVKLIERKAQPTDPSDLVAARIYDKIAAGQEARSKISCTKAFPKAGLFP